MSPSHPFPQGPVTGVSGTAVVVRGDDIDTDRIIPARFLKCITFEALGPAVFADDRAELSDHPAGPHPFDRVQHQGASILVVNRNFGCGSSREHAPQSLMRWGIRAVIGESFAEIFLGNCLALGIPCVTAEHDTILEIQNQAGSDPALMFHLDLSTIRLAVTNKSWKLQLAPAARTMLLSGQWDATAQLLANTEALKVTTSSLPYLYGFC
jgi:3-isopropylmalate/(R)-2-methylmalate dehydratase small subunit